MLFHTCTRCFSDTTNVSSYCFSLKVNFNWILLFVYAENSWKRYDSYILVYKIKMYYEENSIGLQTYRVPLSAHQLENIIGLWESTKSRKNIRTR